jgi:hypothetical protein
MRRIIRAVVLVTCASSLTACAALTGLDQITENDCVPDLCSDASGRPEAGASVDTGTADDATYDAQSSPDTFAGTTQDGGGGTDAASGDTGTVENDGQEAAADATGDASVDSEAGTEGGLDAGADTGTDAPADSPRDASDSGACGTVYFHDPFDGNASGWTLDTTWSIAEECASPPTPQKGNPDPTTDHTGTAGSGVLGAYVCGNNPTGQTAAFRYATSPVVDVSAAATLKLGFWRWLNSDASGYLTSTVDVYDGASWVNVYTNPSGAGNLVTDAAWTYEEYDVTAQKNAAFQVRFGYALVSTEVYAMSDWNVDDLTLSTATCP